MFTIDVLRVQNLRDGRDLEGVFDRNAGQPWAPIWHGTTRRLAVTVQLYT